MSQHEVFWPIYSVFTWIHWRIEAELVDPKRLLFSDLSRLHPEGQSETPWQSSKGRAGSEEGYGHEGDESDESSSNEGNWARSKLAEHGNGVTKFLVPFWIKGNSLKKNCRCQMCHLVIRIKHAPTTLDCLRMVREVSSRLESVRKRISRIHIKDVQGPQAWTKMRDLNRCKAKLKQPKANMYVIAMQH